jgi:hypothetical protein
MAFAMSSLQLSRSLDFLPIVKMPAVSEVQRFAIAVGLGQLQLGIIFALAAAAATVGLRRLQNGIRPSVIEAFAEIWRRFPDLVLTRLAAALIVSALALTVIGIPLALIAAVRWAFIEQSVLLDGLRGREAMHRSSRLVGGNWWSSATTLLLLSSLAMTLAPAAGILLMLSLNTTPLLYANLLSAVVFACLVPYLATALALTYFEFRAAESATPR